MKKTRSISIGLVIFFSFAATVPYPLFSASFLSGHTIVLDPGHATLDFQGHVMNPGKFNGRGQSENKIALEISQKLGKLLEEEGANVVYTRTPFDYWREGYSVVEDNKERALFANDLNGEVFVAIHCDWDGRTRVHGVTTIYESKTSRKLAELVHRKLLSNLKAHDRMVVHDSYTVLDYADMPAILVETGFLSNRAESKKLGDPDYQQKIAQSITDGLRSFFAK